MVSADSWGTKEQIHPKISFHRSWRWKNTTLSHWITFSLSSHCIRSHGPTLHSPQEAPSPPTEAGSQAAEVVRLSRQLSAKTGAGSACLLPTHSAKEANQPHLPPASICADQAALNEGDTHCTVAVRHNSILNHSQLKLSDHSQSQHLETAGSVDLGIQTLQIDLQHSTSWCSPNSLSALPDTAKGTVLQETKMYAIFYHFWLGQGVDKTNATHSNVYQRSCSEFHLKAKKNNFFFWKCN